MRFLLDTHAFLWFIDGNRQLSVFGREAIEAPDNQPILSIASLWEIGIKISLGRLDMHGTVDEFPQHIGLNGIVVQDIAFEHIDQISKLAFHHRDPFDRMIVAQAIVERWPILSIDKAFDAYPVTRIW